MDKALKLVLCWILIGSFMSATSGAQILAQLMQAPPSGGGTPTLQSTHTTESTCTTCTSPAISASVGDNVWVICRTPQFGTAATVTSSPSNTFTLLGSGNAFSGTNLTISVPYSQLTSGGSTTFNCGYGGSNGGRSMIVLDWSNAGSLVVNASSFQRPTTSSTSFAIALTTSQRTISMYCYTNNSNSETFTAGNINGVLSTMAEVTGTAGASDMGCEYLQVATSYTAQTSNMSWNVSAFGTGVAFAMNY